jgi:hypothetical protein
MQDHKRFIVVLGLLVVGLLAACNKDAVSPDRGMRARPGLKVISVCTVGKWTGGGRIDPPNNHDVADETSGGQPVAPNPPPLMTGKVTFGFNVFLGSDASGNCIVNKGEIEVNGHVAKIAWHVSIHDGIDAFSSRPVFATTFADASGGNCLVVGVPSMTARANPQGGFEETQFEVCDNDRGAPQNSGRDAMRWRTAGHGDTGLTFLTGGNIVDHT